MTNMKWYVRNLAISARKSDSHLLVTPAGKHIGTVHKDGSFLVANAKRRVVMGIIASMLTSPDRDKSPEARRHLIKACRGSRTLAW